MSKEKNAVLEKQDEPNPLADFLIGTLSRLDVAVGIIQDLNRLSEGGKTISKDLQEWVESQEDYFKKLEEAKLFESMVLKIQRPLASSDPEALKNGAAVLVYNETQSLMAEVTISPDAYSWFGDDPKMYVMSRLWFNGTLQLTNRVPDQPW